MYKRHFISTLIRTRHYIAIIALLTFIVGSQNVPAQSQLAQDAYAIFEASCLNCHGPDGAFRETLLMEHSQLINGGIVVPGNPNASELYKRLLGTTENGGAQMPLGQEPLPPQSIDIVRRWILAGAPDWTAAPIATRRFIQPAEVLKSINTHVKTISPFDRPFARYFTMTHLYNAGVTADILDEYRKALAKLVNSLSWGLDIVNPQPIDPQQTIFHMDLRHYEWDRNDGWAQIEEAYPYHVEFNAPALSALRNQLSRLQTTLKTAVPSVHIDWFIAVASSPPLYNALLSLPETDKELEERLEVDVVDNILTAPGIRVWRAGFNNSGVSNHNRVVERHASRYGAYWKSYDFAGSVGKQNIFTHPLAFTHDGSEVIFNLPNGLQGYYLVDGDGFRLDEAPISIVSNPAASDPTVRNGLSCIGCHTEGMKEIDDQVRAVIESDTNPAYNKAHALQLYVVDSTMDSKVNEDLVRYQRALTVTGNNAGDVEPVSRFHEAFHSPLDLSHAAAAVGLEPSVFLSNIRENAGLQSAGLLVLNGGQIKRDTWTSGFDDIISALDFPTSIGDTPVVVQPDLIPGAPVHIPDPNLRASIAETLGVQVIRASDMDKLTELRASSKNISDLTGLEHARNLEKLWIKDNPQLDDNPLDLSPLAKCTNLVILDTKGTRIADFSPIAGLTKLEWLWLQVDSAVNDMSSLASLTNLRELVFYGGDVVDISSLANMTELRKLTVKHNAVVDVSPLANLTKLEFLSLHNNRIADLSPLAALTNLSQLSISVNEIEDISPLAGLINLRELWADSNKIGDLSPIDHIIPNLERYSFEKNLPLIGEGGPKIEGPWLWIHFRGATLSENRDILAEKSGGEVTEIGVATNGAIEGNKVGRETWTSHKLPTSGERNIDTMLGRQVTNGALYGVIDLYLPSEQETTMYIGISHASEVSHVSKIWLNGSLILETDGARIYGLDYTHSFPTTLRKGRNVLMVAVGTSQIWWSNCFFGFAPDAKYSLVPPGLTYAFSESDVHVGDTFDFNVSIDDVLDLGGWQFDINFAPSKLRAIEVIEGNFLKNEGSTFFQGGSIDNIKGKISGIKSALLTDNGVNGTGTILQVRFKAKAMGAAELSLSKYLFGTIDGDDMIIVPQSIRLNIEEGLMPGDVNRDGVVNILDLIRVARKLGQQVSAEDPEDVNGDGVVNIFDLTITAQNIAAPSPARTMFETIESWITQACLVDDGSIAFRQGIANLEALLATMIPQETELLPNYPNPFNPETWIPYQLASPSEVALTIYDMSGETMRHLEVGHQSAGTYRNRSRALYWDGRNQRGESVASGLYFYTLKADDFTATRKMLIRK